MTGDGGGSDGEPFLVRDAAWRYELWRRAVGWKGSENALYDLGHYRYRYDLSNIIGQVDSQPFFTMMPESAPLSAITVDNATLTEKAIL